MANEGDNTVTELNASTGGVVQTIPVGNGPDAISSDGTHVWVSNESDNTVTELDASTGAVVQTIGVGSDPRGVSSYGSHVWVSNEGDNSLTELATKAAKIDSVKVTGSNYGPTVTIKGTGFGSVPAGAALTPGCGSSGSDYNSDELYFNDSAEFWQAGFPGNCVGIVVSSYTNTKVVFTFGSTYATNGWFVDAHDRVTVGVSGATKTVTLHTV